MDFYFWSTSNQVFMKSSIKSWVAKHVCQQGSIYMLRPHLVMSDRKLTLAPSLS